MAEFETINSIIRQRDGARFVSVSDLRIWLMKSANTLRATKIAEEEIRAQTMEDIEKQLASLGSYY